MCTIMQHKGEPQGEVFALVLPPLPWTVASGMRWLRNENMLPGLWLSR